MMMQTVFSLLWLLSTLICTCQGKVLGDACAAASECTVANSSCITTCVCKTDYKEENGACPKALTKVCTAANECVSNAKCAGTGSKTCSCKDGYYVKDGLCSKAVGSDCGSNTICPANTNTECKVDKCVCKGGYAEKTDFCEQIFGSACRSGNACPAGSNTQCKGDKCICKEGYAAKNDVCTPMVSNIDCSSVTTACDGIDNAACVTGKCKCNADSTMNIDKCDPKSDAAIIKVGAVMLALSLLTTYSLSF